MTNPPTAFSTPDPDVLMTGDIAGWDMTVPFAESLERGMEDLQGLLSAILYDEEEATEEQIATLSGIPYCGCSTCETREFLYFLVPRIADALERGLLLRTPTPTDPEMKEPSDA